MSSCHNLSALHRLQPVLVAQASACACLLQHAEGARIPKQLWFRSQIRTHRIEFDVTNDIVPFLGRPNPAIERFILPERLASSTQQFIGMSRGYALQILSDLRPRSLRFNQKVDVIRHDDKRGQVVQRTDSLAITNSFCNAFGDSRLFEPGRAERRAFEFTVGCNERTPVAARSQGESSVQSKCDEQRCSVGVKVGEVAAVFHGILVARTVRISQLFHRLKPVLPGVSHE
jgi:hypothetical protein